MMGEPPSDDGTRHVIVQEVSDIPDTSTGPIGADGFPGLQKKVYLLARK